MYKKQMSLQRIFCLLSLAASVIVFVYSLGIMTDLYDTLYSMIPDPEELDNARVAGARIFYDMQDFNRGLLYCGIVLILLSCLLFLTNTHVRRRWAWRSGRISAFPRSRPSTSLPSILLSWNGG